MAAWMIPSLKGATTVWIARRPRGGVSITERSRKPPSDIFSVRGMGVADMVSTSTLALNFLSFSFAATPKRCSSSTIRSPRSWKPASFESRRCVPIRMSTLPASVSARTFFCSRAERKRLTISTRSGNAVMRHLEGGAHGELRLAVPDVAAQQAVHGLGALEVVLDVLERGQLVRRLFELERFFKLLLPGSVGAVGYTAAHLALGVEPEEL